VTVYPDLLFRRRIAEVLVPSELVPCHPRGTLNGVLKHVRAAVPVHGYRPTDVTVNGETGPETVETTRIDRLFIAPFRKVVVKKLTFYFEEVRCYVDAVADTYHYRYYGQLCSAEAVEAVGGAASGWDVKAVVDEKLIDEYSRGAEAAAGWYNYDRYVQRVFENVFCPGWLAFRWRGTSWTEGGATSGIGYTRLGNPGYMGILLEVEVL